MSTHTLPKILPVLDSSKATRAKCADVGAHVLAVSNYLNHLHAFMGGPDDSPVRLAIAKSIAVLSQAYNTTTP